MGLINRCRVCHKNYTPHGLEDILWVMFCDTHLPMCKECTDKLIHWIDKKKGELEEPEDGKEKQDT